MSGNYVVDVQASDSSQVLQVPLLKHPVLKQQWHRARKDLKSTLRCDLYPLSDALELQSFVRNSGLLFGKDATKWRPLGSTSVQTGLPQGALLEGNDRVDVVEDETTRTTKRTGVYAGVELKLFFVQPCFDERLEKNVEPFVHSFGERQILVDSQDKWLELIGDIPLGSSVRKKRLLAFIHAKCRHGDPQLKREAMHALWELVIDKSFLSEIDECTLQHVADCLNSEVAEVARLAAAVVWGVARVAVHRHTLADLGAIPSLLKLVQHHQEGTPSSELDGLQVLNSWSPDKQQSMFAKEYGLGALAMLMVDKCCRAALIPADPELQTILKLCQAESGCCSSRSCRRRVLSAKLLLSLVQRDHEIRMRLVESGGLEAVLALLKENHKESKILPYCMASILAAFVVDDDFMEKAQQRKATYRMFECCLQLLKSTLRQLGNEERSADPLAEESIERDGLLPVRICEGCAQAIWGSSYYCALYDSDAITLPEITDLAEQAIFSSKTSKVCLLKPSLGTNSQCRCRWRGLRTR